MNKGLRTKITSIVLACAMLLSVSPAMAQTSPSQAGLLALIAQLQAQIAALTSALPGHAGSGHVFSSDLTVGSVGSEVTALQDFLISKGYLTMPIGVSKGTFGPLTQSALSAFQAASGITPASGYFGPITRARVNSMSTGNSTPGAPIVTIPGSSSNGLFGGAGDIVVSSRSSGLEDEVLEGKKNVKVLGFEVEATDSDISLSSVRVELKQSDTSGSKRLNRYVQDVSVMKDNKVVGSAQTKDFSESRDTYSRNIPVSNAIVREGDKDRFFIAVSAVSNVDTNDIGKNWEVALGQIRFNDATGAVLTNSTGRGIGGAVRQLFTFEDLASSGDVSLIVRDGDQNINDAHTIQVDMSRDTKNVKILSFTIKSSGTDAALNSLAFDIESFGAGVTEIANDFRLMSGGNEVGKATIDTGNSFASSSDTTRTVTIVDLDDDEVIVKKDREMSFTLVADINDIDGGFTNGDSLSVLLDGNDVDAEDENGEEIGTANSSGTASSNDITFASTGIMLHQNGSHSSSVIPNSSNTSSDDQGKFIINFTVTAFDEPAYIALTAASGTSTDPSNAGAYAYVETPDDNDVAVDSGETYATLERVSGGTLSGNYLKVNEGQTANMRLTVYYDPDATGIYRAQLHAVNFAKTAVAGTSQQVAVPTSSFQSPSEQVMN